MDHASGRKSLIGRGNRNVRNRQSQTAAQDGAGCRVPAPQAGGVLFCSLRAEKTQETTAAPRDTFQPR